jgi:putative protease
MEEGGVIGIVTNFYKHPGVAVVKLSAPLVVGMRVAVKGATTNFEQTVESIQIEHENIERASAGQTVGLKVDGRVRRNDKIYRL